MTSAEMKDAARKLASELVYSVRGWQQRSPEFMQAKTSKWAEKLASFASSCIQAERKEFLRRLRERASALRSKISLYERRGVFPQIREELTACATEFEELATELESEWSAES